MAMSFLRACAWRKLPLLKTGTSPRYSKETVRLLSYNSRALQQQQQQEEESDDRKTFFSTLSTLYGPFSDCGLLHVPSFKQEYGSLEKAEHLPEKKCRVAGRVMSRRRASNNKLSFYDICTQEDRLQIVASHGKTINQEEFKEFHANVRIGDIIEIEGFPGKTKVGELSVFATKVSLLVPCLRPIPEQLKDEETRVKQRSLDLLVNDRVGKNIRARAKVLKYLRSVLDDKGFVEVETPVLGPLPGGANAKPFETTLHALSDIPLSLRVAPELYLKQLVVGGLERVFEIGKQFRNEGIDGSHHPEFSSCEFYAAYMNFDTMQDLTEKLVRGMAENVHGSTSFKSWGHDLDFSKPFDQVDFMAAIQDASGASAEQLEDEAELIKLCKNLDIAVPTPATRAKLLDTLAGHLVEPKLIQPTFLCNHPICLSPLAKSHPSNKDLTHRFELFIGGKEICNAYSELNDPEEQRQRFADQAKARSSGDTEATPHDEVFCSALEYGLPPTVGWGMGLDRMVMLLTNSQHIRDVLSFPLHR